MKKNTEEGETGCVVSPGHRELKVVTLNSILK